MSFIDRHQLAAIGITGSFLDVLGALYLAYDILGGKYGPLRTLTRAVTYGILFGVGFGIPLGIPFGIAAGLANGVTIALELARVSKFKRPYPFRYEVLFSAIRGIGYAIGATSIYGPEFGAVFGVLSTAGQIVAYRHGIRPSFDLEPGRVPRITRNQLLAALLRTFGFGAAGYISAAAAHHQMHALIFGVEAGLSIGIVSAIANALMPFIEWLSENMQDRRMGVFGIALILSGFALQSVQYWVALMDIPVR